MEWIDGELTLPCGHVFEREDLSRTAYHHMAHYIQTNFDPELSLDENWSMAGKSWNALSPETQGHLFIISNREVQCGDDIRQGLLATLASYQGVPSIKALFESAIRCTNYK